MAGEVIVHVAEHFAPLLGVRPQDADPRLDLGGSVDLNSRVVNDALVGAHPADVEKVGGGTRGEREHLLALNPATVAQRERDVVLGEQREDAVVNPATLAEFDREANVPRKLGQELGDGRELQRSEVGTELNQDRSELVAELTGAIEEL